MKLLKVLILCCLFTLISCDKNEETDPIYKFKDYIYYSSSGVQSRYEPITIRLAKKPEHLDLDQPLDPEIFKLKPFVQGSVNFINSTILEFVPNEPLEPGKDYSASIDLKSLFPSIPKDLATYSFQFKTITPGFTASTNSLQSYSKEWQYLDGNLRSADILSLREAKQLISAQQGDKQLNIVWNELIDNAKFFEFKIDSIQRLVNDTNIKVEWDGSKIKAELKGSTLIQIPGKNNFNLLKSEVVQTPEQYLLLNFSDPLKKQQNFDGLVSIENVTSPKFIVDGNSLKVYPDKRLSGQVQVEVFSGILNTDGYKLKSSFSEKLTFEELKPQVRLLSNASILPDSKNLRFNFEAVNLSAVDVRIIKVFEDNILQYLQSSNLNATNDYNIKSVGRRIAKQTIDLIQDTEQNTGKWRAYSIDLSNFFTADPGSIYRVELSFKKRYSLFKCGSAGQGNEEEQNFEYYDTLSTSEEEEVLEEQYWDNVVYNYRNNNYRWRDRNNPCTESYYINANNIVAQNLIASNLGVIVKQGTDGYLIAVNNILTSKPEADATVILYNYQQQELQRSETNTEGIAKINSNKKAAFVYVTKGDNHSYIKLKDGNALSLSKFDVSGKQLKKGLKGYIYGERGVWRPGDTLHLTFILNDKPNPLPTNHPVKLEVSDPVGKLVFRRVKSAHFNHFYSFKVPTSTDYKTGNYSAKISVGGAKFTKNLKIETVKPNRLKIDLNFDQDVLHPNDALSGDLNVSWLHGAPAKNLKAEVTAKFVSTRTQFKGYPNYTFDDPSRTFSTEETSIFSGRLNQAGKARIIKTLSTGSNAPGMLQAQFLVRAFETGGDFSLDAFSQPYAPYKEFVGLQSPEGTVNGSYITNSNHTFNVISMSSEGIPIAKKKLMVKVYKIEWRWWWNSTPENLANYVSSNYHRPFKEFNIETDTSGKGNFTLNIPDSERGRYLIRVINTEGGHATGRIAYFYKNWWGSDSTLDKESAQMLVFATDKKNYNVGETAKLTFPSSEEGRALISIETGADVLDYKWVDTNKGETVVDLPITSDMAPNSFINISLLQKHEVTSNDLPIRLYGVIPVMVEDPKTKLHPNIKMKESLRPNETFEITISEDTNRPMSYTVALVEEGLLDLTRFQTPNPWNDFYAKEALGVKTWDLYNDVIGAYSGSVDQIFAIGGDGTSTVQKNKKANRFKPVVHYLGPFNLEAGATASHVLKMPNYMGSVRAMVIAGNQENEAYGSAERTAKVKQPLMTLATLPRKLSPGESVTMPVSIFAMESKIKDVTVSIRTGADVKIKGDSIQSIKFQRPDEKMLFFNLDVSMARGPQVIEVIAEGNGEQSSYSVEIDVINPNPVSTKLIDKVLEANTSSSVTFSTFGVQGTNSAQLEFSTLPPMNFTERQNYLIRYPHGCLEQTTSSVFAQLYLPEIFDLSYEQTSEIQSNIENGIRRLSNFQQPNGGLSYWMGEESTNDWGTSYAGHFMLEAEQKGFVLPLSFKSNWIRYQTKAARAWRPKYRSSNSDLAQAYRLYTLALAGKADLASMNRLREFNELSLEAKWRLAGTYALAGQPEAATALIRTTEMVYSSKNSQSYTYGSVERNKAMALETMIILNSPNAQELARAIGKFLSGDNWLSTQTTAYCLLSLSKLLSNTGGKSIDLSFTVNGKSYKINTPSGLANRSIPVRNGENTISLDNAGKNKIYLRIVNSGKLKLGEETIIQRGLTVSTAFKDTNGDPLSIHSLKQGQDLVMTIEVKNTSEERVKDIALSQIIPSGWEIINTRFTDFNGSTMNAARYTDIRDDRINFYFDLGPRGKRGTKTFTILLNAAYLGTYYLPGTQTEAMYDEDYLVRTKGQWVEVKQ